MSGGLQENETRLINARIDEIRAAHDESLPSDLLDGALAGVGATVPMTIAMELMHSVLPEHEQYPLPPREITEKLTGKAGVREHSNESAQLGATLVSHFAYGAAVGALYAPLSRRLPLPPAVGGAVYGLAVWAGSYLGLLPALGILRPATEHPARRNALMIAAHLVWGSVNGVLVDQFQKER